MSYKNLNQFLVGAAALPAAIEEKLPSGAPKISTRLVDAANKLPTTPDFPIELPDLPEPKLPTLPAMPGGTSTDDTSTTSAALVPTPKTPAPKATSSGSAPFVFE